jgi:hypothetical protein
MSRDQYDEDALKVLFTEVDPPDTLESRWQQRVDVPQRELAALRPEDSPQTRGVSRSGLSPGTRRIVITVVIALFVIVAFVLAILANR